jgi:hypothetical protein
MKKPIQQPLKKSFHKRFMTEQQQRSQRAWAKQQINRQTTGSPKNLHSGQDTQHPMRAILTFVVMLAIFLFIGYVVGQVMGGEVLNPISIGIWIIGLVCTVIVSIAVWFGE